VTTNPTEINGLVVDGTTYNVTFSTTALNSFVEGSSVSIDARQALAAALNSLSVTGPGNSSAQSAYVIDIDNSLSSFDGPFCDTTPTPCGAPLNIWEAGGGTLPNLGSSALFFSEAADFTVVGTVPEALTLSLFGAGLVGAVAMRRRKTKKV